MNSTQILAFFSGQTALPGVHEASSLAALLQSYGGWGLAAILMLVCAFLFRAYVDARNKNDGTLEAQVKASTTLVESQVKTAVELQNALENLTSALQAIERRLENVEKKGLR